MQLFYTKDIYSGVAYLADEEARHCAQVLRKRPGDEVLVVDGKGGFYKGVLEEVRKKDCSIAIREEIQEFGKRNFSLHIAIAPTKNISRLEWFLEKATEIGIDEITPIICQRSERRKLRMDRLQKILVAAMKQSVKAYLPTLNEPLKFGTFIKNSEDGEGKRFIAHCEETVKPPLQDNYEAGQDVCILIGPEGDFSPEEIQLAQQTDFTGISLGPSRLRTETAGLVACHTVNLINEKK